MRNFLMLAFMLLMNVVVFQHAFGQTETKDIKIKIGNEVKANYTSLKINPCWHCDDHKCENCPEFATEHGLEEIILDLNEFDKNKLLFELPSDAEMFIELDGPIHLQKEFSIEQLPNKKFDLNDLHNGGEGF